jgi:hypothetical protein
VAGETRPERSEPEISGGDTVEGDGICLEVADRFDGSRYATPDPQTCTVDSTC